MKKKGFTLIELLAVIVILAIIALILTPVISNIIDSARKSAFKRTVDGVLTSAKYYTIESNFENFLTIDLNIILYCRVFKPYGNRVYESKDGIRSFVESYKEEK